jgi:hypothetical protein
MNQEKLVISASRTKDLVRVSPERLADVLTGDAPVRFGLGKSRAALPLDEAGALVVWTKDPSNMLIHERLNRALRLFLDRTGGVIVLNLTVTGLAGTALEPGLPAPVQVRDSTAALLGSGLTVPDLVILRYDPLILVKAGGGRKIGNISPAAFESIRSLFVPLGVKRYKTSLVDSHYQQVPERLWRAGLTIDLPGPDEIKRLLKEMYDACHRDDGRLDICCFPEQEVSSQTAGCVDGQMINRALSLAGVGWRVTTRLHNDIGRQRRTCRCTYSRDIGYSAGFQTCFKNHGACLYCYSQKNLTGPAVTEAAELADPSGKTKSPGGTGQHS